MKLRQILSQWPESKEIQRVVDFLNLCYEGWGNTERWIWLHTSYSNAEENIALIMETDTEIIGYRDLFFGRLVLKEDKILVVSTGNAAVKPDYRGQGVWSQMQHSYFEFIKEKGACLSIGWYGKGSITYNYNRKSGFMEIKRTPVYFKIIKPEKVIGRRLKSILKQNIELKKAIQDLKANLVLRIGKSPIFVSELLQEGERQAISKPEQIEIILDKASFPLLSRYMNRQGGRKLFSLTWLCSLAWLLCTRKLRIRFTSLKVLLKAIKLGFRILVHV